MPLDPTPFTPWSALAGGVLIGLAAVLTLALLGRIAGIAGITAGAVAGPDRGWRVAVVAGLVLSPLLLAPFAGMPSPPLPMGPLGMAAAGLIAGFGAALGSGCTSGHGVCGLARLSPRSAAAVATFMATAFAIVWLLRHGGLA